MNAVEIEEAVSAVALAPFDRAEFPFAFLTVRSIGRAHFTPWAPGGHGLSRQAAISTLRCKPQAARSISVLKCGECGVVRRLKATSKIVKPSLAAVEG